MKLPANDWRKYVESLSKINEAAARKMQEYIDIKGTENTDELVAYAHALATKYGEASGALACEMYDSVAEMSGVNVPAAQMAQTATYGETAKAIYGTMLNQNNPVPQTVGRLVKQVAADTTLQNGLRDGAKFAWIPHGDTCAFCLMLASNGWQRVSKRALRNGHAEHIHPNCDCEYAISFDANPQVGGYDPDYYRRIYDGAEGDSARQKINYLRREMYKDSKKEVNSPLDVLEKKHNVKVDISKAKDESIALENVKQLEKLMDEYNSTCVSYSVGTPRGGMQQEDGNAYMLNGKTSITVFNSGFKIRKATDSLKLGEKQPIGITYHEFAHSLSQSKEKNNKDFWKEMRALRKEYRAQSGSSEWFSKIKISDYADYDIDEFMAEAFTQAKLSKNPSPYATKALKIIDKYFKR